MEGWAFVFPASGANTVALTKPQGQGGSGMAFRCSAVHGCPQKPDKRFLTLTWGSPQSRPTKARHPQVSPSDEEPNLAVCLRDLELPKAGKRRTGSFLSRPGCPSICLGCPCHPLPTSGKQQPALLCRAAAGTARGVTGSPPDTPAWLLVFKNFLTSSN